LPWAGAPKERLNPQNGLCLNSLHDAAFDAGLITLSSELKVVISRRLKEEMPAAIYGQLFAAFENSSITQPEKFSPMQKGLAYHRENIFH
jgi:putative restriction endonuclease